MSWYAAILLPQFPLQAALRFREDAWGTPIAVVDGSTEKGRVLEMTETAAASGVLRGMVSTQAMARCRTLRLWPRSPAREQAVREQFLELAGSLSPLIEDTADGLCLVDLRQMKSRDWNIWAREVVDRCATRQLRALVGLAANPDLAALAAARAQPTLVVQQAATFLASIAVAEVDIPPELAGILRDWGISHLGQFAHLARNDVMERLGPSAGELWECAAGRAQRELRLVRPPEVFCEVFDFERPIETTEPLLFILRRQLDQLTLRLREVYRVATQMTLTLPLESGAPYERLFTIPSPTCEVEVLLRILTTHLEDLRLEQQPTGVRLLLTPVIAKSQQFQLFESPLRDPNRFGETLGRLAALVGPENVGVVQMEDSHRPDRFQLVTPEFETLSERPPEPRPVPEFGLPLQRFRPPLAAQVHLHRDVPQWVSSIRTCGEIIDAAGPYRISGHWWDRAVWSVEEWDVELSDGSLYRLSKLNQSWFLEGYYDAPLH